MTTLHLRNSIGRPPLRLGLPRVQPIWIIRGFLLIPLVLACFALPPTVRAQLIPPPDGFYLNNNTAEGEDALFSQGVLPTAFNNTALGFDALFNNTSGNDNTATGFDALYSNTIGTSNTANGFDALYSNTDGGNNTANGWRALFNNTTGTFNTANGSGALLFNTTGFYNTANGVNALYSNTTGALNTATGVNALLSNSTGGLNTATGLGALRNNTTGSDNTAHGLQALYHNTAGTGNTAEGFKALFNNTGSNNIGLGSNAGLNLTTGGHNIDIGNQGVAAEANTIRIGTAGEQARAFIAGIRGVTTANANAVPVVIDSAGQLGTLSSSRRFKKEIKAMDKASQAILDLKPVTFQYKSDSTGTPQFGLIAEEVAKTNPDLVVHDADGQIYTVRYDAVNAMLLNEFLKEHRKVEEQDRQLQKQAATIGELKSAVVEEQTQIKTLASGLEKVSAQLELNKPAPQMVGNNQ